jgi:hypothetical protein
MIQPLTQGVARRRCPHRHVPARTPIGTPGARRNPSLNPSASTAAADSRAPTPLHGEYPTLVTASPLISSIRLRFVLPRPQNVTLHAGLSVRPQADSHHHAPDSWRRTPGIFRTRMPFEAPLGFQLIEINRDGLEGIRLAHVYSAPRRDSNAPHSKRLPNECLDRPPLRFALVASRLTSRAQRAMRPLSIQPAHCRTRERHALRVPARSHSV